MASALAMRHLWNTYFDFAALHTEAPDPHAVRFTVTDYQDIPAFHAMIIAGWHVASAELGGASKVTCECLERPWLGDTQLSYLVKF